MKQQVRAAAWLQAVPDKADGDKSERVEVTRAKQYKAWKVEPDVPPFDGPGYLLDLFWEIGPVMTGGMGMSPVTHSEIESWQRNVGVRLSPWEVRTLRRLSIEYIGESSRAKARSCTPPWNDGDRSFELRLNADHLMHAMRQMAAED